MILDSDLVLSSKQAVTVAAASSNSIDLGVGGDAVGNELVMHIICSTTATGTAGSTLKIALQTADDAAFTTPKTLVVSGDIALASLTKGSEIFNVRMPPGAQRYIRAYYTPSAALTAGNFTTFLTSAY